MPSTVVSVCEIDHLRIACEQWRQESTVSTDYKQNCGRSKHEKRNHAVRRCVAGSCPELTLYIGLSMFRKHVQKPFTFNVHV